MATFREYREALAKGEVPDRTVPVLPSDAIAYQGERAGFVSRAIAASIDVILVFLVVLGTVGVLWMISFIIDPMTPNTPLTPNTDRLPPTWAMMVYGYLLNLGYWTLGWATGGRTIGNLIMGVRVVNFKGDRVRWFGAFVRALFCTFFPIGLLWVIVSGQNRSVQDLVLRTNVIYDWIIGIPGLTSKPTIPRPPQSDVPS